MENFPFRHPPTMHEHLLTDKYDFASEFIHNRYKSSELILWDVNNTVFTYGNILRRDYKRTH